MRPQRAGVSDGTRRFARLPSRLQARLHCSCHAAGLGAGGRCAPPLPRCPAGLQLLGAAALAAGLQPRGGREGEAAARGGRRGRREPLLHARPRGSRPSVPGDSSGVPVCPPAPAWLRLAALRRRGGRRARGGAAGRLRPGDIACQGTAPGAQRPVLRLDVHLHLGGAEKSSFVLKIID